MQQATLAIGDASLDDPAEIAREMGAHLEAFAWTHFVTLTSEGGVSEDVVERRFKDVFIRRIAYDARHTIPYFFALEGTARPGNAPHVHALIGGTSSLTIREVRRAWPFGVTDVRSYDPARGAATYIAKGLLLNPDNYNVSRKMPSRIDAGRLPERTRRGSAS